MIARHILRVYLHPTKVNTMKKFSTTKSEQHSEFPKNPTHLEAKPFSHSLLLSISIP